MNLASNSKTHDISSKEVSVKPVETNSRNKRKSKPPRKWNSKDSNLCLKMNKLSLFRYIRPENQSLISSQEKQSEFYREYLRKAGCSMEPIKLRFTRKKQVQTDGLGTTSIYEVTDTSNEKHSLKNVDFSHSSLERTDDRKKSETNNSKENNLFGVFRNPKIKSSGIYDCLRVNGSNKANQFNPQGTTDCRKLKTSKKTTSKVAKNSKMARKQSKRFLPKFHENPTRKQPARACKVIYPESKYPIHKFIHQDNISSSEYGIKGSDSIAKRSGINSAIPNFQHSTDSISRVKTRALQNNNQDHSGKRKKNVDFTCKKRCKKFHENKSIPQHKSESNWFFLYHAASKNKDSNVKKYPIRNEIDEWPFIHKTDRLRKSKINCINSVSDSLNSHVSSSINDRTTNNCNGNPQKCLLQNKAPVMRSHNSKSNESKESFNVINNQWTEYRSPNHSKRKLFPSDNQLNISRKIRRLCQNKIKFDQHRFKSNGSDIGPLALKNKCQNVIGKKINRNKETDSYTEVRNALLNTTQIHNRSNFENEHYPLNRDNSKTMLSNRMFNNHMFNNNIFNNHMFNKRIIQNETAGNSLLTVNVKYDICGRFNERCLNIVSFQRRIPKHSINSSHRRQPFIKEINDVLNISSTTFIQKFENARSHSFSNIFLSETYIFNQRILQNRVSPNYFSILSSSRNIIWESHKRKFHELNNFQVCIRKSKEVSSHKILCAEMSDDFEDREICAEVATNKTKNIEGISSKMAKSSTYEVLSENDSDNTENRLKFTEIATNEGKSTKILDWNTVQSSLPEVFLQSIAKYINDEGIPNDVVPDENLHKNNFRNIAKDIVSIDNAIMLEQYSKSNHDSSTKSILREILTKTVGNNVEGKNVSNVTTKIQTRNNNIDMKIAKLQTKISSKGEAHIVKEKNNSTKILTVISKSDKFTKQCNAATSMNETLCENTIINLECESKTNNVSINRRPDIHSEKTSPHVVCLQSVKSNVKDARNGSKIENNERKNPGFPDLNTELSSMHENFQKCMTNNVEEIKNCNETTISRLEQNSSDGNTTNSSLRELFLKTSKDTRNFTVVGIVRGENVSSNKAVSFQENFFEFKVNVVKNGGKTSKVITMRRQNDKNVRIIKSSSCKIFPVRENNTAEGKRNAKNASTIQSKTAKKRNATTFLYKSDSKNMAKSPVINKSAENKKKSNDLTIIRTQNSLKNRKKDITDSTKRQNIHNTAEVKSYSHTSLRKTKTCDAKQNLNQEANVRKEIAMEFDLSKIDSLPINMPNVINCDKKSSETIAIKRQNNNIKTTKLSSRESWSKNVGVRIKETQKPYAFTTDRKKCSKNFCSAQTLPVNLSKDNDNVNGDGNSCLISTPRKENSNDFSSIKSSSLKSKYQNLVDKEKSEQNSDEIVIAQRNNEENNNLCDTGSLRGNLSENTCNVKKGEKFNTLIKTTNTFYVITKLPSSVIKLALDNSASNIDNNPNCNINCSNGIKNKLNLNLKNADCSPENLSENMTSEEEEKTSFEACISKHVKTIDALSREISPKHLAGISYSGQNSNKVYSNAEKNIKVVEQGIRNSSSQETSQECVHVNVESNPASNESTLKNIEIIDLTDDCVSPESNNETSSISQQISKSKFDFGEVYIERIQFREYTCSKCNGIFTNQEAFHRHKNQCEQKSSNQNASFVSHEEPHKREDYIERAVFPCTICRKFFSTYKFKKIHELQCRVQVPNSNDLKNTVN